MGKLIIIYRLLAVVSGKAGNSDMIDKSLLREL